MMTEANGKLLIVDLGGVVLDNHHVRAAEFVQAWSNMLRDIRLPESIQQKLRNVPEEALSAAIWSKTPMEATHRILAQALDTEDRAASQIVASLDLVMRDVYKAQRKKKEQENLTEELTFPGVAEALRALKGEGYRLVAISRKDAVNLWQSLQQNGLDDIFSESDIVSTHHNEKTPAGLHHVATERGFSVLQDTLLIGDTLKDMSAAAQIRMHSLLVRWGHPVDVKAIDTTYAGVDVLHIDRLGEAVDTAMKAKIIPVALESTVGIA